MAEPITMAAVAAKQDEVRSLARRLAEATSQLAVMHARFELDTALETVQALAEGAKA